MIIIPFSFIIYFIDQLLMQNYKPSKKAQKMAKQQSKEKDVLVKQD